jgi:membrane-associated phospholipid phosphatase
VWFADVGVVLGLVLVAGWLAVFGWSLTRRRAGHPVRGGLLVGTGVAAVLFAAQSWVVDAVADPGRLAAADQPVLDWVLAHRSGAATAAMVAISDAGGTVGMALLAAVGAVAVWSRGHRGDAAVIVVAALGSAVLLTGFKNLYERARPPAVDQLAIESTYSLPSGHSLGSAVVIGVLAAVAIRHLHRPAARVAVGALAGCAVALIGVSRLYLGVHWTTDVLVGWLLGGAWLALCLGVGAPAALSRERSDTLRSVDRVLVGQVAGRRRRS